MQKLILIMVTVCSYHVTHVFQSEYTLYSCLNVKELLAQNRRDNSLVPNIIRLIPNINTQYYFLICVNLILIMSRLNAAQIYIFASF